MGWSFLRRRLLGETIAAARDQSVADRSERSRSISELPRLVESLGAELVALVPGAGLDESAAGRAARVLERTRVPLLVLGPFSGIDRHRLTPRSVAGEAGCEVALPHRSAMATTLKHGIDRVAAAVLLVVLTPFLVLLAVAVRLDSAGPPFFTQVRIGHHGRPFRMYKLRTMVVGAEELKHTLVAMNDLDGALFKMRRDPRTTRIGCFLRRTSLDELPQLFNVVAGDMSLVGPRPLILEEDGEIAEWGRRRLDLKPGITGIWQVLGRDDIPFDEMVNLDYLYVTGWSLQRDGRLLLCTLPQLGRRRNP